MLAWLCMIIFSISQPRNGIHEEALKKVRQKQQLTAIGCTPDWNRIDIAALANDITPLPGSGNWTWKTSTKNDSAQFYFNQGINLYYGFHIIESVPSFRKAQQFDPQDAMLYWGEALALGPNINDVGYSASVDAKTAADKAAKLSRNASPKEQVLIKAMQVRYSFDSLAVQAGLNEQYAAAMKQVYLKFPDDADIGSLYADALMLLHPWDFWNHDGTAKSWTPDIVALLEKTLQKSPRHPGANHYYIHVVEASDNPEKAMASADRLGSLAPSLSHLVHMPSHIYVRTGKMKEGIAVNTDALIGYQTYKALYPAVADKADLYEIHNRHMQVACAINLSDYGSARKLADSCRNSIPQDWLNMPLFGGYIQFMYLSPDFTMVAYGRWDEILQQPDMPGELVYANILQAFCRGLAHAQKGRLAESREQLAKMDKLLNDSVLAIPIGPMNAPKSGGMVARNILAGSIAEAAGKMTEAIEAYSKAVELEDAMIYNEPKDWLLPARRWLGMALIQMKANSRAQKVFEEDLRKNPGSNFSERGLAACKSKKQSR